MAAAETIAPSADAATKERDRLPQKANMLVEDAKGLKIVDSDTYQRASQQLVAIKSLRGEADAAFDPIITDAHRAHKTAIEQKKKVEAPLIEAEGLLKRSMSGYITEQERKRREEERQLQEEAERQAREARQREVEALRRQQAEQEAEAKRLREAAELAAMEAREREIEKAEAAGASTDEVAALVETPLAVEEVFTETIVAEEILALETAPLRVAPVFVAPTVPKVSGIGSSQVWKFEVTNKAALDKYIAANPRYSNLTVPSPTAIGGLARALKSAMNIPGIRVWQETNISARRS
jgi:uncharacterized protein YhaN